MKRILLAFCFVLGLTSAKAQTTYYWVGNSGDSINTNSNWNTVPDGSGSSRPASNPAPPTPVTDILIFDGSIIGTNPFTVTSTGSISCGQMKFINNVKINMTRISSGTTTITIAGGSGEDFAIDAGSSLSIPPSTVGSLRFAMAATNTGRVSGALSMVTGLQARFDNTTAGTPGSFVFTSGSSFTTNITSSSSSYAFGSSSQSSEKWVVFEAGSHLYYEGGYSPNGSGTLYSAIDMKPGSTWHHRATNPTSGSGNFFNRKNYGSVSVENSAALNALGSIYSIENLTVTSGSSFVSFTSGQTVVLGNLTVDGSFNGSNTLVLGGNATQTVSGAGSISANSLVVSSNSDVVLNKNISVANTINVFGKINFSNSQLSGAAAFNALQSVPSSAFTGSTVTGQYFIGGITGFTSSMVGQGVTGTGIDANTNVVSYSSAQDTIYLSKPVLTAASGASFTLGSQNATLATSNANGFDAVNGSVIVSGNQNYQSDINYIINSGTSKPFGISTGSANTNIVAGNVVLNAPVTTNTSLHVTGDLQLNAGKVTIRPQDTVHVRNGAKLSGSFGSSVYFATDVNTASGAAGVFRMDGINSSRLLPVGTLNYYLPATINPATASDFSINVFEGITSNGLPNGSALPSAQKLTKVDAVWNINRINGSGNADLTLQWDQLLEGSTFSSFADSMIGIIINQNPGWSLPLDTGHNATNMATATISGSGAYSVGAKPPAQAFVFNPLTNKTYGNPDFDPGALSVNTTQPIIYASSNPAVATIVNGNVHITGAGTTDITATQATDGFYPAVSGTQTLVVNKADLTVKADDKSKAEGDPNPALTITYTGFVNGETSAVLTTPVTISTTAVTASAPGTYPITVSGAAAANYNISYVNGIMTVTPRQAQTITFPAFAVKTYGNPDFAIGASSSNTTIPITYTTSNPAVATIVGNNIHIVGAGTATITAAQQGNTFFFPAASVSRTLTVNKANLTVRVLDTVKQFGQPNPAFTITYSGFVLGQNAGALTTAPTASTPATTGSPAGYYSISLDGGVSSNYNFIYTNGRLTIFPPSGTTDPYVRAYMPDNNTLTVRLYSSAPDLGEVILYDMKGNLVARKNVFIAQGFLDYNFDVRIPASGVYIIHIIGKNLKMKTRISIIK